MREYERLDVWRRAHDLALEVHHATVASIGAGGAVSSVGTDVAGGAGGSVSAVGTDVAAELRALARELPAMIVRACARERGDEFAAAMRDVSVRTEGLGYRLQFARDAGVLGDVPYARLEARTTQLGAMLGSLTRTVELRLAGTSRSAGRPRRGEAPLARGAAQVPVDAPDDDSSRRRSRPRSTS